MIDEQDIQEIENDGLDQLIDEQEVQEVKIETPEKEPKKWVKYVKKLGLAGFLFFLIKGLVWIAIFIFGAKGCSALVNG